MAELCLTCSGNLHPTLCSAAGLSSLCNRTSTGVITCNGNRHPTLSSAAGLTSTFFRISTDNLTCNGNLHSVHSSAAGKREKCRRSSFFFSPAAVFCLVRNLALQMSDFSETRDRTPPHLQRKSASFVQDPPTSNIDTQSLHHAHHNLRRKSAFCAF